MAQPSHRHAGWSLVRGVVLAAALCGGCFGSVGYVPDDYDDVPPPAYVATAQPYYYEGHPTYWYHDHWHFREGGRWHRYRNEPPPLRQWRTSRAYPPPSPVRQAPPPEMRQEAPRQFPPDLNRPPPESAPARAMPPPR